MGKGIQDNDEFLFAHLEKIERHKQVRAETRASSMKPFSTFGQHGSSSASGGASASGVEDRLCRSSTVGSAAIRGRSVPHPHVPPVPPGSIGEPEERFLTTPAGGPRILQGCWDRRGSNETLQRPPVVTLRDVEGAYFKSIAQKVLNAKSCFAPMWPGDPDWKLEPRLVGVPVRPFALRAFKAPAGTYVKPLDFESSAHVGKSLPYIDWGPGYKWSRFSHQIVNLLRGWKRRQDVRFNQCGGTDIDVIARIWGIRRCDVVAMAAKSREPRLVIYGLFDGNGECVRWVEIGAASGWALKEVSFVHAIRPLSCDEMWRMGAIGHSTNWRASHGITAQGFIPGFGGRRRFSMFNPIRVVDGVLVSGLRAGCSVHLVVLLTDLLPVDYEGPYPQDLKEILPVYVPELEALRTHEDTIAMRRLAAELGITIGTARDSSVNTEDIMPWQMVHMVVVGEETTNLRIVYHRSYQKLTPIDRHAADEVDPETIAPSLPAFVSEPVPRRVSVTKRDYDKHNSADFIVDHYDRTLDMTWYSGDLFTRYCRGRPGETPCNLPIRHGWVCCPSCRIEMMHSCDPSEPFMKGYNIIGRTPAGEPGFQRGSAMPASRPEPPETPPPGVRSKTCLLYTSPSPRD